MNPYITQVPPYMSQDQQGLNPVYQNIGAQQQYMNQQLAQNNQMAQPQQRPQSSSGMNPMDLAKMLRNQTPQTNADAAKMNEFGAYMPWNQMAAFNQYGTNPYSEQSLMLASQDLGMK